MPGGLMVVDFGCNLVPTCETIHQAV